MFDRVLATKLTHTVSAGCKQESSAINRPVIGKSARVRAIPASARNMSGRLSHVLVVRFADFFAAEMSIVIAAAKERVLRKPDREHTAGAEERQNHEGESEEVSRRTREA